MAKPSMKTEDPVWPTYNMAQALDCITTRRGWSLRLHPALTGHVPSWLLELCNAHQIKSGLFLVQWRAGPRKGQGTSLQFTHWCQSTPPIPPTSSPCPIYYKRFFFLCRVTETQRWRAFTHPAQPHPCPWCSGHRPGSQRSTIAPADKE